MGPKTFFCAIVKAIVIKRTLKAKETSTGTIDFEKFLSNTAL
jgi:hypothetical protein